MTGSELKKWREKYDLTQVQLAAELDVAPSTVARWERGKKLDLFVVIALKGLEAQRIGATAKEEPCK